MRSHADAYLRLMRLWNWDRPATTLLRARAFLRRFPQSAAVWASMGRVLTSMARYGEARAALATSMRLRAEGGKEPVGWTCASMGDSFEQAGDFQSALAWYLRALALSPEDADVHFCAGSLLHRWGRFDEAEDLLRRPRQCSEGDRCAPWLALGRVLTSREQFAKARRCFRKALKIDPDDNRARRGLEDAKSGIAHQGRWSPERIGLVDPCAAYERMDRGRDDDKPAHNVLLAREYLAVDAENSAVWIMLGKDLTRLSRYAEARDAIGTSVRIREEAGDPPYWVALVAMAESFRRAGDYRSARAWYRRAVAANLTNAGVHIFLGSLLAKWGLFEQAKASHLRGTGCDEGCRDEAWHNLGLILRAQERFAESAECLGRALAIDPHYTLAHEALEDVTIAGRIVVRRRQASRAGRGDFAAIG
jgi:tetratricopeptide (TPR) repeat protein